MEKIRQPIITVVGHVDHGKTSILDSIRKTSVQESESGGITQKISFTSYPMDKLKSAYPLIESSGFSIDIPGFLFIDTPGHAAFTNLRKRGGSLADLAILVIDINEGIKPQTAEVINILKRNKTPFLIVLNKIDNISGWKSNKNADLKENILSQSQNVQSLFQERYMTLIGSLNSYGFESDLFYNIKDFTKKIALIPCSAITKEGIQELIMMLCGLSQKYLSNKLKLSFDARGVLLEVKEEKSMSYSEAILYDGTLNKSGKIAVSNLGGDPIITKIRILEEVLPLSSKFKSKSEVQASTGIRIQFTDKLEALPGMPFVAYKENKEEISKLFQKELSENINQFLSKKGVIAKADSLGSLEALLVLLKQSNVPVVKASIGNINKTDIISAKANLELSPLDSIVVGFNTKIDDDALELSKSYDKAGIKVLTDEVIYKLIENLQDWRKAKQREIEKEKLLSLASLCKLKVLRQYVFRNTSPAIFGVRVEAGKLVSGIPLIDNKNEKVARVKNLQSENKSISEASEGQELSISLPGINFERRMKDVEFLYSDISESQFRNFKKNKDILSSNEIKLLQEMAELKKNKKADWGM